MKIKTPLASNLSRGAATLKSLPPFMSGKIELHDFGIIVGISKSYADVTLRIRRSIYWADLEKDDNAIEDTMGNIISGLAAIQEKLS